jgi:hypothetical protein
MERSLILLAWLTGLFGISLLGYWRMHLPVSPRQFDGAWSRYGWGDWLIESGWLDGLLPALALALALILAHFP